MNDQDLQRAFAQAREPLADDGFLPGLLAAMQRRRRRVLWIRIAAAAGVAVAIGWSASEVLDATAAAAGVFLQVSASAARLLVSPWGWVASLLLAAGIVRRARSLHR